MANGDCLREGGDDFEREKPERKLAIAPLNERDFF
jgi:hypothetical protein